MAAREHDGIGGRDGGRISRLGEKVPRVSERKKKSGHSSGVQRE